VYSLCGYIYLFVCLLQEAYITQNRMIPWSGNI
jgi:hypothetical protein